MVVDVFAAASVEPLRRNELLHPHVAPTNINESISNKDNMRIRKDTYICLLMLEFCLPTIACQIEKMEKNLIFLRII